jgi:Rad4/Xp-C family protein
MIPENCVWVKSSVAKEIANDLEISYADACVGFKFHGGKAVPKIQGIVIKSADKSSLEKKIEEYEFKRIKESLREEEDLSKKNWMKVFSIVINNREYCPEIKKDSFSSVLIEKNETSFEDFDII